MSQGNFYGAILYCTSQSGKVVIQDVRRLEESVNVIGNFNGATAKKSVSETSLYMFGLIELNN